MSETNKNRSRRPSSPAFKAFMASNWDERGPSTLQPFGARQALAERHRQVGNAFIGKRIVVPAGDLVARVADTDHRFRANSSFIYLTGLEGEKEPGAVLVLEPVASGEAAETGASHEAVLYFAPRASRASEEFYANARHGEFWVGARPSLEEMTKATGLATRNIDDLEGDIAAGDMPVVVLRGVDPAVEVMIDAAPDTKARNLDEDDTALAQRLAKTRMRKDAYEIEKIEEATVAVKDGFDRILAAMPRAIGSPRGERILEGAFFTAAREHGNGVSFDTIIAASNHANTLHWTDNSGAIENGDLVLIDAGIEMDSLYSADITRTFPANGKFTNAQKRVYEAVLKALEAGFEAAGKPGAVFGDIHDAAQEILAGRLAEWGVLPVPVEESLTMEGQQHRRWMPHGTSHHLGLDVHDCSDAPPEDYMEAALAPGMVFTIEPGLYFREDDLAVPEELRGIGVRIEDNVRIGEDGKPIRLSSAIPRTAEDVEQWMAEMAQKEG